MEKDRLTDQLLLEIDEKEDSLRIYRIIEPLENTPVYLQVLLHNESGLHIHPPISI